MDIAKNYLTRGPIVNEKDLNSLRKWYPVTLTEEEQPVLWWRNFGDIRFSKPFFDETIRQGMSVCKTTTESLSQFTSSDCIAPSAFIFHSSRCGSTLLTQLLTKAPNCIVFSEPPIMDAVLQYCFHQPNREAGISILKGVVRALGQRRLGEERHLFIKLDSWHINLYPIIREAFPEVPCFFMYRKPVEILASHRRQRGPQMVPGLIDPEILGVRIRTDFFDLDSFCLKVLSHFYKLAIRHSETDQLVLINYNQLPQLVWTEFASLLSVHFSESEILTMQERCIRHSKDPYTVFSEDKSEFTHDHERFEEVNGYYNTLEAIKNQSGIWNQADSVG